MKEQLSLNFKGTVRYTVHHKNYNEPEIVVENLIVDGHKDIILNILGSSTSNKHIGKVIFGTDSISVSTSNDLSSFTDGYIKPLSDVISYSTSPYKITFSWSVELNEFVGKTLRSIGLVSNDETILFSKRLFENPMSKEDDVWITGTWEIEF